ncbi:MAG: 50S ribosomal protein L25 [Candidatus Caenarcaniphilales bacterium]|jgi:large subunit ribosomal protein L25|nr:50S ribosomal protein L25 [Candidatus Caenarcaniphilales bacterium]
MAVHLPVSPREKNSKPRALRRAGFIPATVYGPEIEAKNIQLSAKEFSRVSFEDYSHLMFLQNSDGTEEEALIKNVQKDSLTRAVMNIEFYKVKRGHKVNMKVAIKFVGDSQAVKLGADFVAVHKEAHIRCFPRHIPYFIEVDISKLEKADDHITFADLNINREEIEIMDPESEIICKAETKRKDHMLEPVETATVDAANVPTVEKEKKDKEEAKK